MALLVGTGTQMGSIPTASGAVAGQTILTNVTLGSKPPMTLFCQVVAVAGTGQPPVPTTLTISPNGGFISVQNGTLQLVATVKDQYGNVYTGATVAWSTNNPTYVTVNASGLCTGIKTNAVVLITATVAGTTATASVQVTTPASIATTFTINAGFSNLAAAANAGGWQTGFSVNDSYEGHLNYAQNYQQMAGPGGIGTSEKFLSHWVSAVNTGTGALTTNFQEFTQEFARMQANGTAIELYVLNGSAASQWPGLSTYITNSTTANTVLTNVANAITGFFATAGSPAAYNGGTAYSYGNTVTSGGFKWTCIIPTSTVTGVTPALGAVGPSGAYAWLKTTSGAVYCYNGLNEGIAFGGNASNPFTAQLGAPTTWAPGFYQKLFAGDPGAKLMVNGNHFAYDGSGNGSTAQATATLALMSAIATAGSVGGASNLVVGIEGHVTCSIMQTLAGTAANFNATSFTAFVTSIVTAGYGYAITEFDVTDDMFEGTGPSGIPLRLAAIGTATQNYLNAVQAASAKPLFFLWWQLRSPESWINVNNISPRTDGQTQYPDLYQDLVGTQQPSYTIFYQFLLGLSGAQGSVVLTNAAPQALPISLLDQWGFAMSPTSVTWSTTNPQITVSTSGVVQALSGGQVATIKGVLGQPSNLSATVSVSSSASVLTSLAVTPPTATLTSGTLQLLASGVDQFGNATQGGTGGIVNFGPGGTGLSANIASVASISTQLWAKGRILVDSIRALALNGGAGLLSIDSDGAGTNKKFEVYLQTGATAAAQLAMAGYSTGSVRMGPIVTGFSALTGFPAAGNYVEWFASWDATNTTGTVTLFDNLGNILVSNTQAVPATLLSTDGGANGRVTTNKGFNPSATAQAMVSDGLALYSGAAPVIASRWSKPQSGDAGIDAAWLYGDATSGTYTTATALAGGTTQALTSATGGIGDANAWSVTNYNWVSDNTAAATVTATGGLVSYVSNGVANITASLASNPAITGSSQVTTQALVIGSITVNASVTNLTTLNQTSTLTAVVKSTTGVVLNGGYSIVWASSQPSVISVTPAGGPTFNTATATMLASGGVPGVFLTATIGTVSGSVTLTTPLSIATTLTVSPSTLSATSNQIYQLQTTTLDQFGVPMAQGSITWSSSNVNVTVSSGGAVQANKGGQSATITATNATGQTGTCAVTSTTAALTAIALSPGNTTLTSGQVTEVPTLVDQFGATWPLVSGGGCVSITNIAGIGLSANVPALATITGLSGVMRIRVDAWNALASGQTWALWELDNGTIGPTTTRIECYLSMTTTGGVNQYFANIGVPGQSGCTTNAIPATSMPPNGSDVVIYWDWYSTVPLGFSQRISVYSGAGTNTLIDPNATKTQSLNAPINTVASGGQLRINDSDHGTNRLGTFQGIAFYSAARTAGSEDKLPTVGDANIIYFCNMNDATSGTSPSTSVAAVGTAGIAWTASDYTYAADNTSNQWGGGTVVSFSFASNNNAVDTVTSNGVVSYVAPGTATITATYVQNPAITGRAIITNSAVSVPTTMSVNPTSMTLQGSGSTGTISPTVDDQNTSPMSGVTVDYVSSNTGVATVAASSVTPAGGLVTYVGNGTATVTATAVGGAAPTATCVVTATAGGFNMPGGFSTQVNSGVITAIPANGSTPWGSGTWNMISPGTVSGTGEWSGNLTVVPAAQGTGLRLAYDTNLAAGNSPVRFINGIPSIGTGWYYQRWRVRFSTNWTLNGNPGCKMAEPRSSGSQQGSGAGSTVNDVVGATALQVPPGPSGTAQSTQVVPGFFQQGPNGISSNYCATNWQGFGSILAGPSNGSTFVLSTADNNWHWVEYLMTPESSPGAGDGIMDIWVDVTSHYQVTGRQWLNVGMTPGWANWLVDPTYGGAVASPPFAMYWDFDQLVVATK